MNCVEKINDRWADKIDDGVFTGTDEEYKEYFAEAFGAAMGERK